MPSGYIIDESMFTIFNESGFLEIARSHANIYNLTCPHLAIKNIPPSWVISKSIDTTVNLRIVGDGELYDGRQSSTIKQLFGTTMKEFMDTYPLVTVSFHAIDVNNKVGAENMAGLDMYESIQQSKLSNLATQEVTAKTASALIAQYEAIMKYLNTVAKDYTSLQKDVAGKPYTEFIAEVDAGLALVLALIDDIRKLYLPNLRRARGG
jgi:hypothetical protein